MALRPKITEFRKGPNNQPPERVEQATPLGPRDVVLKLYDISSPTFCTVASGIAFKEIHWFPKLCVSVGERTWTWAFDGGPKETYAAMIEDVAGAPPLRKWNLGVTELSDSEIDAVTREMGLRDYQSSEYCLFSRNCNHFGLDLAERLAPESGGLSAEDLRFIDSIVLHESEAILNNQPGFQQAATRFTFQMVQKAITPAWRSSYQEALRKYEEEQQIPLSQRLSSPPPAGDFQILAS